MSTLGVDYAWMHPDPASLAAAGYRFACRYLSRDPSKNLTLAEAQALEAHGIAVVANWEYGAQDMLRGHDGGVADAQLALTQATAAGMPAGRPIYFSADWDVTPAQEAAVSAYLSGVDSVLGVARTGEYAGFYPVKIARDSGLAAWSWQTSGWSGGQWDPRDQIRQTGTATVGGVQVDVNEAMVPDFGQWFPGASPTQPPGVDMPLTTADAELVANTLLDTEILRAGHNSAGQPLTGSESLRSMIAWSQSGVQGTRDGVAAVAQAVAKLGAPPALNVDATAVAAALVADPAFVAAIAHAIGVELHHDTPAS